MVAKSADLGWGQRHPCCTTSRRRPMPGTTCTSRSTTPCPRARPLPTCGPRWRTWCAATKSCARSTTCSHGRGREQVVQPPAAPLCRRGDRPAELIERLTEEPFDITKEWPIRAGVIADGDAMRRLHLVFNHLSLDDVSLRHAHRGAGCGVAARIARRPMELPPSCTSRST